MIVTRAPGKLYVAGEYAVVEPGEPAVLIAVDRYLTVRLSESTGSGRIRSGEYGSAALEWTRAADGVSMLLEHQSADYVFSALQVVESLRDERGIPARYFDLDISSELDDAQGRKFGLGSSAAVTVAVIEALDQFYGLGLDSIERFKVALLATIRISPNASGGDLAASTFGGWVLYTAPDRAALRRELEAGSVSEALAADAWDLHSVTRLPDPVGLELLVGWTGSPASTNRLVDSVRGNGREATTAHELFLQESRQNVDALVTALQGEDADGVLTRIRTARRLLQQLGESSGIRLETPALTALCDAAEAHGAAGKPSGAGGGDCGIVLVPETVERRQILSTWETHDIRLLDLSVHPPQGALDEQ
ncbi:MULTISPECIES: phosphomevalonate kinase [Brachybacterium]|uniref:phosphomevalonate kinase n=1 Tax=Brachybacterium TaxID=43668 RepID=UPI000BB8352A|nr:MULTISPECIES: phosphomevalonate kinase [Brachybacterium]PCC32980.1 phosphomevalonate kinase [Brachybacterium alimentarium]RCS63832.1 phosphomevalonate kinase [Brachybacterium sp. JB7]RCS67641.1 phosphomevalonate kinase [Brachybacterium alimentarium]RCS69317.1 phosphomevalonate kinase [Brachybacterium alimentarium]RCS81451.1 phosphomevalonate kinase [Brachybacterium alimentarium]